MSNIQVSSDVLAALARLEHDFEEYDGDDEAREDDNENRNPVFKSFLKDTCELVRTAEAANASNLKIIVERADQFINQLIAYAYGEADLFENVPSFAHTEDDRAPLIDDRQTKEGVFSHGFLTQVQPLLKMLMEDGFMDPSRGLPKTADPWDPAQKPHPNSTPMARFRKDPPTLSATADTPLANIIYQARAQVLSDSIASPIQMAISSGKGSCLALLGMGGWKNRSPLLSYYLLDNDDPTSQEFPESLSADVGLTDVARYCELFEEQKLIFVADTKRIKSYAWGPVSGEAGTSDDKPYEEGLPTHTLDSRGHTGPLKVLRNERIVRAGKGSAAVWNVKDLDTHGAKGKKRIGGKISTEDTWRDDPEDIENSKGNAAATQIAFADPQFTPSTWHAHPTAPASMICASEPRETSNYACVVVDLDDGGKTSGRYLGHGGTIDCFSTSEADPNNFLTACSDGVVRLYDTRHPLPVLSLNLESEDCGAALLVHPDGIPTVFTGCGKGEQIKLWDIRARTAVYELATGNNAVNALAWDSRHNTLYAATECSYMGRMGNNYGYREAKIPERLNPDDYDEDYTCWPARAYHAEDHFGHFFDAGEHRIYRYAFSANADTDVVPPYGQASMDDESGFF
ncbi:hypothetical protein PLICRDRAFT_46338 [Plicaturopsis crispa FD-325 SS-3]|uniref:WD40 repeat-like protein n=1 Tax=Plicaturopsis crispa FD-325 SS-3 TaxID=944288 RepID=A0A0C9T500_PLICR|nr:hypothetical protein PLICRDRAFT_46338 [Plicaturopsis crispa FD-325 SS-3]